jgi:hypothetical protein
MSNVLADSTISNELQGGEKLVVVQQAFYAIRTSLTYPEPNDTSSNHTIIFCNDDIIYYPPIYV